MKTKNWKSILLITLLLCFSTILISITPVRAVRQISGSETWTGNISLTENIYVVGNGELIVDGATVRFDDLGNWWNIQVHDNAKLIIKNSADLEGKVTVWYMGHSYEQWIGEIYCLDSSIVSVTGSKVGRINVRGSSAVTVNGGSDIHAFYAYTAEELHDGTASLIYSTSTVKPVIRGSTIRQLYMTVTISTGTHTISGSNWQTLNSALACDLGLTNTIERLYLLLQVTGTGIVTMDNLPARSTLGYWLECKTKDGAKLNMTTAPMLDLSQEPLDRQAGYDSIQTRIKAFGTANTIYLIGVTRDYIDGTGEPVYIKDSTINGIYYHNDNPNYWYKFGTGRNNGLGWFDLSIPTPPLPTGQQSVSYIDDYITVDKTWTEGAFQYITLTIYTSCHNCLYESDYISYFWSTSPQQGRFDDGSGKFEANLYEQMKSCKIIRKDKYPCYPNCSTIDANFKTCTVTWKGPKDYPTSIKIGCFAVGNGFAHLGDAEITLYPNGYQLTQNSPITPLTIR